MPGLLDLSIVTDKLLAQLREARGTTRLWSEEPTPPEGTSTAGPAGDLSPSTPFDIVFTGMPPDAARNLPGACKVSLYLFHVEADKFYRNTFPADPRDTTSPPASPATARAASRARQVPQHPLGLTLFYLLSAHSESYVEEQQAMTIALKAFHDHAIVTATVPLDSRRQEFTVVMEAQSVDDVSRLWQSVSTPLRLSAVYRASVIFLEPEPAAGLPVKPVETYSLTAYPQFVVSRAIVTNAGHVTVWGQRFTDPSLHVRLDGQLLTGAALHVIDASSLEFELPHGTRSDQLLRLGITLDSERLESIFTIKAPADVP